MTSWTYSEGQQADFHSKFDPKDYISQWPTLEVGPYDELLQDDSSGASSGPFDFSMSNAPSDPSSSHTSSQFSTPDLSIRMQMPVPQHMLNPSQLPPSNSSTSPFDFSIPIDNNTSFDFMSTAEPSSVPFAFNLDINPRDIDEDGAIHLNWGLYQDDGKNKDHAQLFYDQIASIGNVDDSYESDSDPDGQSGNGGGGASEDNAMVTYDTNHDVYSTNGTESRGATHFDTHSSFGYDILGLCYGHTPSSPPTGPMDHSNGPSPSSSSQRNFTGPNNSDAVEYHQPRNYTGPIDLALFEHLQPHDTEQRRSFSGSSGETYRQPSPTTEDIDRSNSNATIRQPYAPPRGAANTSRRVGGTFNPNYTLRATSGGNSVATSSSPSSKVGPSGMMRRGALDLSVDPLDRGPHSVPANGLRHDLESLNINSPLIDPISQSSQSLRSHR